MIQKLFDTYVFLYIMGGLCVVGILIKLSLYFAYRSFIKASDSVSVSKKRWMKQMKLKFETCYQLKIGVNNVDVFVDKYVSKRKFCGLLLSTWENISGQMITLCLLIASIAGILGIVYDCGKDIVLFTFLMGAVSSIVVIIVDNLVNISEHKKILFLNLKDYFENYLKVRLEREHFYPEELNQYRREYFNPVTESKLEMASAKEANVVKAELRNPNIKVISTSTVVPEKEGTDELPSQEDFLKDEKSSKKEERMAAKVLKKEEKINKKEAKAAAKLIKKSEKILLKRSLKDEKLNKKVAKREEILKKKLSKQEAVKNAKQARIDKKRNAKQARIDIKLARIEAKQARIDEKKNAKQARINAKLEKRENIQKEKEEKIRLKEEKELSQQKAYQIKMRLKEEKELERKEREQRRIEEELKKQEEQLSKNHELTLEATASKLVERKEEEKMKETIKETIKETKKSDEDKLIEEVLREFLA